MDDQIEDITTSFEQTHISHVEKKKETVWIWENNKMVKKSVTFVPVFLQMFDEILISAAKRGAASMKVGIADDNTITMWSDAEAVLDTTSSNFVNASQLLTQFMAQSTDGGRFIIQKVLRNNIIEESRIVNPQPSTGKWSGVSFKPNLQCVDTFALMKRRVVDFAGCSSVNVQLEGCDVPNTFKEYIQLYLETSKRMVYEKVNDTWEICVAVSNGVFDQVSFVNNIATMQGGSHVDHIASQITNYLAKILNLGEDVIRSNLWIFVNVHADNLASDPETEEKFAFDPETKEKLSFGSSCQLTQDLLSTCELTSPSLQQIKDIHYSKRSNTLEKNLNIPKLIDAKLANTMYSQECTLMIVEGDSANQFPTVGLSVIEEQKYGMFPLKGKLKNVRGGIDFSAKGKGNNDVKNLLKILGLQNKNKNFEAVKDLRYGRIMILADQDHDGAHLIGLILNMFQYLFPSLVKQKHFMSMFITPIVNAYHKIDVDNVITFYRLRDYEKQKKKLGKNYKIKYYKGLGSHSVEETKLYFQNFDKYVQYFTWDEDGVELVDDAFSKKKISKRKEWISQHKDCPYDPCQKEIKVSTFFNTRYIDFAIDSVERTIPSMVDGFTRVRQKVLHTALSKLNETTMSVESFAGHVSTFTHYRHGNDSLEYTISRMLESNVNCLENMSHSDVQARYSQITLHSMTQYIFHKDDQALLNYLTENGDRVQPAWFIPIIPMVLANGAWGIGVGWSSQISSYNPRDLIANLGRRIIDEVMLDMVPFHIHKLILGYTFNVLDAQGTLQTYDTIDRFFEDFYFLRLEYYEKRRTFLLHKLKVSSLQLENILKFADEAYHGNLLTALTGENANKCVVLKDRGFKSFVSIEKEARKEIQREKHVADEDTEVEENVAAEGYSGYEYLLSLPIFLFDEKHIEELQGKLKATNEQLKQMRACTAKSMWLKDLAVLDEQLVIEGIYPEANYSVAEKKALASIVQNLKIVLLQLQSTLRFAMEVSSKDLILRNVKSDDCVSLKDRSFKSLRSIQRKAKNEPEEDEDASVEGYNGYDYLLSLQIESFEPEYIKGLEKEIEAIEKKIQYPMSEWLKQLAASLEQEQEQESK